MSTRSILISYAGYPFTPSGLMPDNGLANLAGALVEAGHETLVLDYGTVDGLKRLYPQRLSKKAIPFCDRAFGTSAGSYRPTYKDFFLLKYLDWELTRYRNKEIDKIALEVCRKIEELRPDFIGFKLWSGDGFEGSIQIAEFVKSSFPSLPIFGGGPHVDMFRETILRTHPIFDALALGDGEETIVNIAESLSKKGDWEKLPNLIYVKDGKIKATERAWIEKLDKLPTPIYDSAVYPSMENNQKLKIITLDESRGCFMGCYFCAHKNKSGGRLRLKSPEKVIEEIEHLKDRYAFTAFRYAGSATPTRFARKIAEGLIEKKSKIIYSMFGNIRISRSKDFQAIKEAGCRAIFFGLESGSQNILDKSLGKRFTIADAKKILGACQANDIFTITSIIHPAPFESEVSKQETLEFLTSVRPDSIILTFPFLLPTSDWESNPTHFGFKLKTNNYMREIMDYKIKWLFPPRLWRPLPYTLNGKRFRTFTKETSEFSKRLGQAGLLTGLSDELVLMAHLAGFERREHDFLNEVRKIFFAGEWEKAHELNGTINAAVTEGKSDQE